MTALPSTITCWVAPAPGARPEPVSRPAPRLGSDDALVAVEGAVVGGPELRALARGVGRAPGGAAVGVVVATGAAAGGLAGRRVLVGPVASCGECGACRAGLIAACPSAIRLGSDTDGALASHVVGRGRWLCPIDGPLAGVAPGPGAAILAREAPLAATLVARAGVGPGDVAIWLGDGVVARIGAALTAAIGARPFALSAEERALSPAEAAASLRARVAAAGARPPPWAVLEASGRAAGRRRVADLAPLVSVLALVTPGAIAAEDDAGIELRLERDLRIGVIGAPHPDLVPETVAQVARGALDLAALVSIRPVAELGDAVAELRAGHAADRAVVVAMPGGD